MKKGLFGVVFAVMILLAASGAWAFTATIDDATFGANTFWGGTVFGVGGPYDDVVGTPTFDVDSMKIDIVGTQMMITLKGPYFTNLAGSANLQAHGRPGDLYINKDGWSSLLGTAPHYTADKFTLTEGWDYVVGQPATGGGFGVYSLKAGFQDSNDGGGNWSAYRADQAWIGGFDAFTTGATISTSGDTMVYTIADITSLGLGSTIGFHWTMECGNDVVEGSVSPVPEPGSMLLLGLGLLGLFGVARRRTK